MPGLTHADLARLFTHHPPTDAQATRYALLRAKGRELAALVLDATPECAEQTLAVRHVQQAIMWANAAIACHDDAG
jgi:hypothetical protein